MPQVDGAFDPYYPSQRHLSSRLSTTNYTVQTSLVTSDIQVPVHCQRQYSWRQESLEDFLPQFDGSGDDDDPVGEEGEGGQQQGPDKGILFYCVFYLLSNSNILKPINALKP